MSYLLNFLYLLTLTILSPWLIYKALTTGKYRRGLIQKFLGLVPKREGNAPCIWFHGVSVGEIILLKQLVNQFRKQHPQYQIVISTTTNTGFDEAKKNFTNLPVFFWPLDFTWAIWNTLQRIRPDLVVLAESELWPNFLWVAKKYGAKVAVVNGRMSPRSSRRFQKFPWLTRWLFGKVDLWLMQTEDYANNVRKIGIDPKFVQVTGNIKYDGVTTNRHNLVTQTFRKLFVIEESELVWVAGSTMTPEEDIVLEIFQRIRPQFPNLRLILVPRQKERFQEVANLLTRLSIPFVRRSSLPEIVTDPQKVILVDTIGELGAVWGLADLAYVGGSLDGRRGGQNMIEPAGYGAAVLFGPHVWNFQDTVNRLLQQEAAIQIADAEELEHQVRRLLENSQSREQLGSRARQFVLSQQGATNQTIRFLHELLLTAHRDDREAA